MHVGVTRRKAVRRIAGTTDGVREYAYDRISKVGKLDKAWDDALAKG